MSPSKLKSYLGKYPDFGLRVFAEVSWLEEPWFDPSPNGRVQLQTQVSLHDLDWKVGFKQQNINTSFKQRTRFKTPILVSV